VGVAALFSVSDSQDLGDVIEWQSVVVGHALDGFAGADPAEHAGHGGGWR
jgi:hypothetical protein